jgi:hypothetical protein
LIARRADRACVDDRRRPTNGTGIDEPLDPVCTVPENTPVASLVLLVRLPPTNTWPAAWTMRDPAEVVSAEPARPRTKTSPSIDEAPLASSAADGVTLSVAVPPTMDSAVVKRDPVGWSEKKLDPTAVWVESR